jgi:probable rRNA maturation factor
VNVVVLDEQDDPLPDIAVEALAELVLGGEGLPGTTEVSVMFVGTQRIAELNETHMGKHGPTDVLSFPLEDLTPGAGFAPAGADDPPFAIGDVVICPAVVRGRAEAGQVPFADEMALMVVHGLLHVLGYDHEADEDAEMMEARERRYLAAVGRTRP